MASKEEMREKLKKECINHIMNHLREVDMTEIKQLDSAYALELAVDLLLACQKHK